MWAEVETREKDQSTIFTPNYNQMAKLMVFQLPAMGTEFDRKAGILTKGDM